MPRQSLVDRQDNRYVSERNLNLSCVYYRCSLVLPLDYEVVYKDREGMFSNLDGRGDYDIINCECCKGNANWVSCSSGPASAYPGIVKRGTRERSWIECNAVDVGDSLVDKLKDKIGSA